MRRALALLVVVGCSKEERKAPAPPPADAAIAPRVAELLATARSRAPAAMGVEKIAIVGVSADGRMDPASSLLEITFQLLEKRPDADGAVGAAPVPCRVLRWTAADLWSEDDTPCAELGIAGLGFAHLDLPRCDVIQVLRRGRAKATGFDAQLEYRRGLPYVDERDRLAPGEGRWEIWPEGAGRPSSWSGLDDC